MIMNLANILKIAYAASKATEMGGYLASGGKANQVSNIASVVGQAAGAGAQMAGAVNTNPGQAAGAAVKADTVNTGQMHEALKGQSGVQETLIQGGKKDITKFTKDLTPGAIGKANALKLNPGGYTANQPGLQEAYLEGLKQSGAKLNNTGQIVKLNGQAFKKAGWDIQARGRALEGVDASRRKDLIAEAQGYINKANALKTKAVNTRKAVSPETPTEPTSSKMKVRKSNKTVSTPVSKDLSEDLSENLVIDGTSKPTTKDVDAGITKQERERWEELKSRRDLTQEEQEEMARMSPKFMQKPQGRLYIKWGDFKDR